MSGKKKQPKGKAARVSGLPRAVKAATKGKAKAKPPKVAAALVLQSEKAGGAKVDRLRYPKGHKKAGQYAPKKAAKRYEVHRWTKTVGGKRRELGPKETGRAKKVSRVELGRTFTERQPAYSCIDAVKNAGERGALIYMRVGGKVVRVPATKAKDAAAMLYDLRLRFQNTERSSRGGKKVSPLPFSAELSIGPAGVLVNLDRMDRFSGELSEEFGSIAEDDELVEDLSGYLSNILSSYLGIGIDAEDIAQQWTDESEGTDMEEEDEHKE